MALNIFRIAAILVHEPDRKIDGAKLFRCACRFHISNPGKIAQCDE